MIFKVRITLLYSILAVGMLTGFGGFWGPSSFEDCRDQAARDAKTEAGMSVLIASCRKQFPKQSELKTEWAQFARAMKGHKYDSAMPIIHAESAMAAANSYDNDFGGFFARKYGDKHMTAEGRAELLMSKEFMNWFVGQPDYVKSLLVSPMLQANEDKIFDAYRKDRDRDF